MGCGQSKIDKIYPRKRKRRGCSKTAAADAEVDEEAEETDRQSSNGNEDDEEARKRAAAKIRLVSSGPLSAHPETSSSQLDFFRQLDEKIEKGADYDSNSEQEIANERARLSSLIRHWESASSSTASSRSLPSTPGSRRTHPPQPPLSLQKQYYRPQQYQVNGDVYNQQHYYHPQFVQQQYQNNIRGQFFMPQPQQMYQYPRVYSQMDPKNFQSVPLPQQATSVVQYRKSRGVYTELA